MDNHKMRVDLTFVILLVICLLIMPSTVLAGNCGNDTCEEDEECTRCPEDCGVCGETCDQAIEIVGGSTLIIDTLVTLEDSYASTTCGGSGNIDRSYYFSLPEDAQVNATLEGPPDWPGVLYLRSTGCEDAGELECAQIDIESESNDSTASIQADLVAGTYYLIVDSNCCIGENCCGISQPDYTLEFSVTGPCEPRYCNDDNPCTIDFCDQATNDCAHQNEFDTTPCSTGDFCIANETCTNGVCGGGETKVCDDENPDTIDECDPDIGCVYTSTTGTCDSPIDLPLDTSISGSTFSSGDHQQSDNCLIFGAKDQVYQFSVPVQTVTNIGLEPSPDWSGSIYLRNADCEGSSEISCAYVSTATEVISETLPPGVYHVIVDGYPGASGEYVITRFEDVDCRFLQCDDFNPCTDDSCLDGTGCINAPNDNNLCPDENECTTNNRCVNGRCASDSLDCDDEIGWTNDYCSPSVGCVHVESGSCENPVHIPDSVIDDNTLDDREAHIQSLPADCLDSVSAAGPDAIYTISLSTDQEIFIKLSNFAFPAAVAVLGSCSSTAVCYEGWLFEEDNGESIPFIAPDSGLYYVIVKALTSIPPGNGEYQLRVTPFIEEDGDIDMPDGDGEVDLPTDPPPENDTCSNPKDIPVPGQISFDTAGALDDYSPSGCALSDFGDMVYRFSVASATELEIKVEATGFVPASVYIRSGNCTSGTELNCAEARPAIPATITNTFQAGTYYLFVDSAQTETGSFRITIRPPGLPLCDFLICSDGNTCTDDGCNNAVGCVFTANDLNTCSDGLVCTTNDRCYRGSCISEPFDCDDGIPCTSDSCDTINDACINTPHDEMCPDDLLSCVEGICNPGIGCEDVPASCDDEIDWTEDSCRRGVGCQYEEMGSCDSPVILDEDMTINSSLVGRPNHIESYVLACNVSPSQSAVDAIYEIDAEPGDHLRAWLDTEDTYAALLRVDSCNIESNCLDAIEYWPEAPQLKLDWIVENGDPQYLVVESMRNQTGDYELGIQWIIEPDGDMDIDEDEDISDQDYEEDAEESDRPDGDEDAIDEDNSDSDVTDGDVTDGDVTDGDVTDGDVTDGDLTDGDTTDGDTVDGDRDTPVVIPGDVDRFESEPPKEKSGGGCQQSQGASGILLIVMGIVFILRRYRLD